MLAVSDESAELRFLLLSLRSLLLAARVVVLLLFVSEESLFVSEESFFVSEESSEESSAYMVDFISVPSLPGRMGSEGILCLIWGETARVVVLLHFLEARRLMEFLGYGVLASTYRTVEN
jgi:hypothetical protein